MELSLTRIIPRPIKEILSSIVDLPMDSESTASVVDKVDIGKFQADKVFTPDNGAVLAALATLAYSTPEDQQAHIERQSAVRSFQFLDSKNNAKLGIDAPDTGTQLSVVETDDALLVAARGTSPPWLANVGKENDMQWQDYVEDVDVVPTQNYDHSAEIDKGFKDAADGIWGQLKPLLLSAEAAHKAIHFSGHSLGAAVAVNLADRMHEELGELPQSVVTTGCPDLGWGDEHKHMLESGLADRTVDFVNNTDPIPHIVPKGVPSGSEIYFDRHGSADLSPGSHSWDRLLGTANGLLHLNVNPLYDHVPVFYNDAITDPRNFATLRQLEQNLENA